MEQERWTSRERLDAVFAFPRPDPPPALGGWLACPEHILKISGVHADVDWAAPPDSPPGADTRLARAALGSS